MADRELKITLTLADGKFTVGMGKATLAVGDFNLETGKTPKVVKAATGSVEDLRKRLSAAEAELSRLTPAHANWGNTAKRVTVLTNHLTEATKKQNAALRIGTQQHEKFGAASGRAGFAVLNMNRIISDAPFGMIAISNNIEPMIQSFQMLTTQTGSARGAMKLLVKQMIGPLGLTTAVSLVTAAITFYALNSRGAAGDTESLAEETEELKKKVDDLTASYEDLAEVRKREREEFKKENIAVLEARRAILEQDLERGFSGSPSAPIFLSEEDKERLTQRIQALTKEINNLNNVAENGSEEVQKNIKILQGLSDAALSGGAESVKQFVKDSKLTEEQLSKLIEQFSFLKKSGITLSGELSETLTEDEKTIAKTLNLTRGQVTETITVLQSFYDEISGKGKGKGKDKKDNKIWLDVDIDPKNLSFTGKQKEVFNEIKGEFESLGFVFDASLQQFAIGLALEFEPANLEQEKQKLVNKYHRLQLADDLGLAVDEDGLLIPIKTKFSDEVGEGASETKKLSKELRLASQAGAAAGREIATAFFGARLEVGNLIQSIAQLAMQMAITGGLTYLFSGGTLGIFASNDTGGIIGKSGRPVVADKSLFVGAKHFAAGIDKGAVIGGIGRPVPIIAHEGETIFRPDQLRDLIRSVSQISSSGANKVDINIVTGLKADKTKFVSDFNRADVQIRKSKGVGKVNVYSS